MWYIYSTNTQQQTFKIMIYEKLFKSTSLAFRLSISINWKNQSENSFEIIAIHANFERITTSNSIELAFLSCSKLSMRNKTINELLNKSTE
jgi:hypothetical protein